MAEAALINYFQPHYNQLFTKTDFAANNKRMKLLHRIEDKGITGLMVEISTANIRAKLKSEARPAVKGVEDFFPNLDREKLLDLQDSDRQEMAELLFRMIHTHNVEMPLTTSEVRNTFLHGMRWKDDPEHTESGN